MNSLDHEVKQFRAEWQPLGLRQGIDLREMTAADQRRTGRNSVIIHILKKLEEILIIRFGGGNFTQRRRG